MKVTVKKWGNSAAVRIPAPVMLAACMELDEAVEIRAEEGRIVIEPIPPKAYRLNDLLKGTHRGNLHRPVDFGLPQGNEVWPQGTRSD